MDKTDVYYYKHAAVILPIKYGAGMKVKTAEAMMYGRTIFASDEALEGYDGKGIEGTEMFFHVQIIMMLQGIPWEMFMKHR